MTTNIEAMLEQLYQHTSLSRQQSKQLFTSIVAGELANEQLAAALIAIKMRGETTDEIAGAVDALLDDAQPFPRPDYPFADIVGTGGDGYNTINISTTSAILAASMGAKIAKHGNRSVSSKSGSSDVLASLGVNLTMSAERARQALDEIGICFIFAQQYHLGFRHAVPVRAALKTRTIFNILGPLINPAKPKSQLLGVYSPELITPYAEVVKSLNHQHTLVVHGAGLDEVALHGDTQVAEIKNGKVSHFTLTPADFGLQKQSVDTLTGGSPEENAQAMRALLRGEGNPFHANAVAANTALLLRLFGHDDIKATTQLALDVLESGKAYETLTQLTTY